MNGVHISPRARASAAAALWALVVIGAAPAAHAGSYPRIQTPVTDLGDYLTAAEREEISAKLVAYRRATGIQLAVLLVPSTQGEPIDDYGQAVFDAWGGGSRGRDDGALFVLAVADHRSRLQLGYALESSLSDGQARLMIDSLRPALKGERYAQAAIQLIDALWAATADVTPEAPSGPAIPRYPWFAALVALLAGAGGLSWRMRRPTPAPKSPASQEQEKGLPELPAPTSAHGRPRRLETIALFAVAPALLGLTTHRAMGSFVAYPLVWYAFAFIGWWWAIAWQTAKVGRWFVYALDLGVLVGGYLLLYDGRLLHAEDCGVLGLGAFVACGVVAIVVDDSRKGGSRTYGRSASSRSSWSPSPSRSSSSSRSYSSRASASSWSGGGGSSGGGGASSSW